MIGHLDLAIKMVRETTWPQMVMETTLTVKMAGLAGGITLRRGLTTAEATTTITPQTFNKGHLGDSSIEDNLRKHLNSILPDLIVGTGREAKADQLRLRRMNQDRDSPKRKWSNSLLKTSASTGKQSILSKTTEQLSLNSLSFSEPLVSDEEMEEIFGDLPASPMGEELGFHNTPPTLPLIYLMDSSSDEDDPYAEMPELQDVSDTESEGNTEDESDSSSDESDEYYTSHHYSSDSDSDKENTDPNTSKDKSFADSSYEEQFLCDYSEYVEEYWTHILPDKDIVNPSRPYDEKDLEKTRWDGNRQFCCADETKMVFGYPDSPVSDFFRYGKIREDWFSGTIGDPIADIAQFRLHKSAPYPRDEN
ncbi:hypothetical protein V5O48_012130 [Marasmius crinis-equi]|uniref:Uncharacterized protein n=1 Tax=Marasmius crinis-equi TaxID=585013 RepID=A0ABR3F3M7_9AGAR